MIKLERIDLLNSDERKLFDEMFIGYLYETCDKEELSQEIDDLYNETLNRQMIEQTLRKHDPYFILWIKSNNIYSGFISYLYLENKRLCFINNFYIIPEQRNKGLGTAAYKAVESHIKRIGASVIELNPVKNALEFYKRNGFVSTRISANGELIFSKQIVV